MSAAKDLIEAAMAAQRQHDQIREQLRLVESLRASPTTLEVQRLLDRSYADNAVWYRSMREAAEWQRSMRAVDARWAALNPQPAGLVGAAFQASRFYRDAAERAKALLGPDARDLMLQMKMDSVPNRNDVLAHYAATFGPNSILDVKAQEISALQEINRQAAEYRVISGALAAAANMRRLAEERGHLSPVASLVGHIDDLTASYAIVASVPARFRALPAWLQEAPPVAAYTGMRLVNLAAGISPAALAEDADDVVDERIAFRGDELGARLDRVGPGLSEAYRGARQAVEDRGADWVRHAGISMRELLDHLLRILAPNDALTQWCLQPTDGEFAQGKWTRRVQLRYIFRDVRTSGSERLIDNITEFVLALFYSKNSAVHTLIAPLAPEGMQLLFIEFQGQLAAILHAAGY